MCGIALTICRVRNEPPDFKADAAWRTLSREIARRGPDSTEEFVWNIQTRKGDLIELHLVCSVLGLRGKQTIQPLVSQKGFLAWNGQVFDGLPLKPDENDTQALFAHLENRFPGLEAPFGEFKRERDPETSSLLSAIEGPYAFVYLHKGSQKLYFGRDPFGRRSLLITTFKSPAEKASSCLTIASVRPEFCDSGVDGGGIVGMDVMEEVDCRTLWELDLGGIKVDDAENLDFEGCLKRLPRQAETESLAKSMFTTIPRMNIAAPEDRKTYALQEDQRGITGPQPTKSSIDMLVTCLAASIRRRVENIPSPARPGAARVAILFSGGIDCTFMTHLVDSYIPTGEPIDLLNVAFENPRAVSNARALQATRSKADARLPRSKLTKQERQARGLAKVERRQEGQRADPLLSAAGPSSGHAPSLSAVPALASTASQADTHDSNEWVYDVPDRITGRESAAELGRLHPDREWRFVEIDVSYEEAQAAKSRIMALMYPSDTEMDLSLALPLYFAARRQGKVANLKDPSCFRVAHQSHARVVLSGLGADELLGGYARHRREHDHRGWAGAIKEMQMDLDRLPTRNLGRDDRIISSHGIETRFPYLSMTFAAAMAALPIQEKCDFRHEEGVGDKSLLRVACEQAGLPVAARLKKRAMQFGTRSARMEVEESGSVQRGMGARKIPVDIPDA